jgi:hypothetical protein
MTFKLAELGAGNEEDSFFCLSFKVGITIIR